MVYIAESNCWGARQTANLFEGFRESSGLPYFFLQTDPYAGTQQYKPIT